MALLICATYRPAACRSPLLLPQSLACDDGHHSLSVLPTRIRIRMRMQVMQPMRVPVIVRKLQITFCGETIFACRHYRWLWCRGIPGNKKCKGSNRHDKCPKYLARSTFWIIGMAAFVRRLSRSRMGAAPMSSMTRLAAMCLTNRCDA